MKVHDLHEDFAIFDMEIELGDLNEVSGLLPIGLAILEEIVLFGTYQDDRLEGITPVCDFHFEMLELRFHIVGLNDVTLPHSLGLSQHLADRSVRRECHCARRYSNFKRSNIPINLVFTAYKNASVFK